MNYGPENRETPVTVRITEQFRAPVIAAATECMVKQALSQIAAENQQTDLRQIAQPAAKTKEQNLVWLLHLPCSHFRGHISLRMRNLRNSRLPATTSRFASINEGSTAQTWEARAYPKFSGTMDLALTYSRASLAPRSGTRASASSVFSALHAHLI